MFRDIVLIIILVSVGGVMGWFGHDYAIKQKFVAPVSEDLTQLLNPTDYPSLDIKLADLPSERGIETAIGSQAAESDEGTIQILNAFAAILYDEVSANAQSATDSQQSAAKKEYRMIGVRLMGEVKNVDTNTVRGVLSSVTFFDKNDKRLVTKRGYTNPGTPFLPLEANAVGGYDIIVRDPPANLEKIEIQLKAIKPEENISWQALKIKDKAFTSHKSGTPSAEVNYYQFTGTLINDSSQTVESPMVLVWLKNSEGRVVAMQSQSYTDDLLSPQKELQASFLIRTNKAIPNPVFEVRTFGKKYEK